MNIVWKIVFAVVAFFAAIWIASFALESFMGGSYPAWTVIAGLVIVSPIVVLLGVTGSIETAARRCCGWCPAPAYIGLDLPFGHAAYWHEADSPTVPKPVLTHG